MSRIYHLVALCFVCLIGLPLLIQADAAVYATGEPVINEFMAANQTTLLDRDGEAADWLELYNPGAVAVSLDGWYLTDDAADLTKWRFPAVTLEAGGYLIVFASGKDLDDTAELHTNFGLSASGDYLALVKPDRVTIASAYSPGFPEQRPDVAYGLPSGGGIGYLAAPTPGGPNSAEAISFVSFSQKSGIFTSSFQLSLGANLQPGDVIRYTLDGSEPTAASAAYASPITVGSTQTVRARVVRVNEGGPLGYASFVKVAADVAAFSSDLPLVVVDTFGQSLGANDPAKRAFVSVADVGAGGRATLGSEIVYAGFSGIAIRGSSSSGFPKKQYKLELWNDQNQPVEADFFGMGSESDWILYAPGRFDRNMIANPFAFQIARDMGMIAMDTQFVEVYFNSDGGEVTAADYAGIYIWMESIKRDKNRVDIEKMSSEDNALPEVSGGYIWSIDRADSNDYSFLLPPRPGQTYGYPRNQPSSTSSEINIVSPGLSDLTQAQQDYFVGQVQALEDVIYTADFADPTIGYPAYLDAESWIDAYILDVLVKDPDALRLSHYFYTPRYGKMHGDLVWDFDRTMESADPRDNDPTGNFSYLADYDFWDQLFDDPDFEQLYVDRWYMFRAGALSTAHMFPLIDEMAAELGEAYPRELAVWSPAAGQTAYGPRTGSDGLDGSYAGEIAHLKWWLNARLTWMDNVAINRHPPTLSHAGGAVPAGWTVSLSKAASAPAGANLYYMLDGRDPRLSGGALHPDAQLYSGPISLTRSSLLKARSFNGTTWSALAQAGFNISTPANASNLVVSEIHYNPAEDDSFEFIELLNVGVGTIDLTGVQVSSAVTYTFGFQLLQPGERIVVVANEDAFNWRYGRSGQPYFAPGAAVAGEWDGGLSNGGESLVLTAADSSPIATIAYDNGGVWPGRADGWGSALELKDAAAVPTTQPEKNAYLNNGDNWRPTSEFHGSPGRAGLGPDGRVVFNEILANSDLAGGDAFELYNTTAAPLDLSNWYVSDSRSQYRKFRLPAATVIGANGFVAFSESQFNSGGNPTTDFALNATEGDELYLVEANGAGDLLRFVDDIKFEPMRPDEALGLLPDGTGALVRLCQPSFGAPNSHGGFCHGPLIINEVQYNPAGADDDLEYIELLNTGGTAVALDGWRMRGEVDFDFGAGQTLPAGGMLVVVRFNPAAEAAALNAFRAAYALDGSVTLVGPWRGNSAESNRHLDNGGGTLKLYRPDTSVTLPNGSHPLVLEDAVTYDDDPPWPLEPDSSGPSLELIDVAVDNRQGSNWTASLTSKGTPGRDNRDDRPTIGVSDTTVTEGTGGATTAEFTVALAHASGLTVRVTYATANGSALAGEDYAAMSGTLEFAPGEMERKVAVSVVGDGLAEGEEEFGLVLSAPQGGTLGRAAAVATIVDDEAAALLSVEDVAVMEGDSGTTLATFTLTLSAPVAKSVTLNYATEDGTAEAGSDYVALAGSLTFEPNERSRTVTVTVLGDTAEEEDETFTLRLTNITGAAAGRASAIGRILDDDGAVEREGAVWLPLVVRP